MRLKTTMLEDAIEGVRGVLEDAFGGVLGCVRLCGGGCVREC